MTWVEHRLESEVRESSAVVAVAVVFQSMYSGSKICRVRDEPLPGTSCCFPQLLPIKVVTVNERYVISCKVTLTENMLGQTRGS